MNATLIDIFSTEGRIAIYPWLQRPASYPPHEHLKQSLSTPPNSQP